MKSIFKKLMIIIGVLIGLIILDTIQALVFNNNPLIGTETKCRMKQGIFVNTYHCGEGKNITRLKKNNVCYYDSVCGIEEENNTIEINSTSEEINSVKVIINGKEYIINLEDNETAKTFAKLLPKEFNMNELNGNEKYVYMDESLPTNESNPKHINVGDVMLYGKDCLVIFYKSFDTSYSYTKIGHIDNLEDLGNGNISAKFE